ncbi:MULTISPECIES: DUF92 domain-containing protein [Bacillaceae]|uniref:DUF92 domain-containing protein n=1 Tax=Bacillaceae TaxID=186817 RepID=UPI001E36B275|nr:MULTISPECIES: DUF92 domain-containing protein [Bacillaceae]MCE4047050.1 DUF92 domain-containing protein [Bacillus sp. Au-Bac7]MDL0436603.1 DUF92 domain-containing protein [Niallia sp. SS-2023]UPO86567.1 DUF92 domain-containing protein [Niallia sp. Man26]
MGQIISILIILIAVYLAWKEGFLNKSGSIAAFFVGLGIQLGFHYQGFILLGVFFLTSSLLSKYKKDKKARVEEMHEKGSTRDYMQVLANGGAAALVSLFYGWSGSHELIILFAVLLAAANSDTWASEIGPLSKSKPFSLRTFSRAKAGTSGAMSLLGTIAGFFGSLLIGFCAYLLFPISVNEFLLISLFGFIGNIIDTLLGAYVQAEYQCTVCGAKVEKRVHHAREAKQIKGFSFLNNDAVNILSGVLAACLAALFVL